MKRVVLFSIFMLLLLASEAQLVLSPQVDSIMLRDNKVLPADIYLPDTVQKWPVVLIQTPYNRLFYRFGLPLDVGTGLANSNFAFVVVDWRCFYGGLGACTVQPNRGEDGYDIVEWIAQQPWSNGKIGTWGPSALGNIQYQTARENPPSLDCICPLVAEPQTNYTDYYPGGCLREEYVDQLDGLGFGVSALVLANQVDNFLWQFTANNSWYPLDVKVPAFLIGGWYDHNIDGMMKFMDGLVKQGDPGVKSKHKILVGPWTHGGNSTASPGSLNQGELEYSQAENWQDQEAIRFFDYYLRGIQNNWEMDSVYRVFNMSSGGGNGGGFWVNAKSWDKNLFWNWDTVKTKAFLQPDGSIIYGMPNSGAAFSSYPYDPRDPSPTHGGPTLRADLTQGPLDQTDTVESRNDHLVFDFTVPDLSFLEIQGKPKVKLFVQSDRKDTDFNVRLTQVFPDGRSMLLMNGVTRGRFRDGFTMADTSVMDTSNVYEIDIDFPPVLLTLFSGEKLRLIISSSNYPLFALNLNDGGPMYVAGDTLVATNRIYHSQSYPSYIELGGSLVTSREPSIDQPRVKVYPNPGKGDFRVELNYADEGKVNIFTLNGRMVATHDFQGNQIKLDLKELQNGVYFLRVEGKKRNWVEKIIKE